MANILLNMFENSIPVSVIIMLLILLRGILNKRYTAKWQYWVWVVITIRLLVPFDISIPDFTAPISVPVDNIVVYYNVEYEEAQQDFMETVPENNEEIIPPQDITAEENDRPLLNTATEVLGKSTIAISDILCAIWICGTFLLLAVRMGGYIIAKNTLDKSLVPLEIDISESLRKLGLDEDVPVYESDMVTTPVLSGIFRPTVIVPQDSGDDMYLQVAIHHELVHFKRYDVVFKLMLFIITCVYWYNPCVWLMSKMALEDIELSCDESIYKKMNSAGKNIYGESILKFASNRRSELLCATSFSDNKHTVATRIKHIFDEKRKSRGALALVGVIAVVVISGILVCFTSETDFYKDNNAVPEQAQNFIDVYCRTVSSDDYWNPENNRLGFTYLYINEMLPQKYCHYDSFGHMTYILDEGVQREIFKFMMADDFPLGWGSYPESNNFDPDYHLFDVQLAVKAIEFEDDNRFKVTYSRTENNIPAYDITFVMEKQIVDAVPQDLKAQFSAGQEIWRIKSVLETVRDLNKEKLLVDINSLEEFLQFAEDVRNNSYNIQGNTYRLNTDIDLAGIAFEPMFNKADFELRFSETNTNAKTGFNAIFDGQGHTISNLNIVYDCGGIDRENLNWAKVGLFGHIGADGIVKNLNVTNAAIDYISPDHARYPTSSGIIAGSCEGQILNSNVQGTVNGASCVGGVAGEILENGVVRSCTADVTVKGYNEVGCLAASVAFGRIDNCTAKGVAIGENNDYMDDRVFYEMVTPYAVGGFIGRIHCANLLDCHSDAALKIMSTGRTIGAFAASCHSSNIDGCTYSLAKAGNWKKIGYYHGGYSENETYLYNLNGV